jgi:hypothetical protein
MLRDLTIEIFHNLMYTPRSIWPPARVTGYKLFVLIVCLSNVSVYNRYVLERALKAIGRGTNWAALAY